MFRQTMKKQSSFHPYGALTSMLVVVVEAELAVLKEEELVAVVAADIV